MDNEKTTPVTHWKKLTDPNYIGAHDFQPNQELTVIIEKISKERIELFNGRANEIKDCILARFKGAKKPMILNKENMKLITKVTGTPYIEQWEGKSVILHVVPVKAFGEIVDAVRVKYVKIK
jgi:hypothetical protein